MYLTLTVSTLRSCCHGYCFKTLFTADDIHLTNSLRQLKGYSSRRFLNEFQQKNWTRAGLHYLLSNIDKYGTAERVPGSRAYYRDLVLRQMLLPDIRTASGSEFFVFQQGSAPSHRAKDSSAVGSRDARFYPTRTLAA